MKIFLLLLIILNLVCYSQFSGGAGTSYDPYQVASVNDLDNIRNYLTSYFVQTSDIDLGVPPWNEGEGWEPIGFALSYNPFDYSNAFSGYVNGNGYTISNLFINKPDSSLVGLFGWTWDAEITDVTITNNSNVTGNQNVGLLIGYSSNTSITNSRTSGTVTGNYAVGGFIGDINGSSTVDECNSNCSVNATDNSAGGFIGSCRTNMTLNILNSYSMGNVSGNTNTGGFAGYSSGNIIIRNCYTDASVNGYSNSGGFIGYSGYGNRISKSFSSGNITSTGNNVGGFAGEIFTTVMFNDSTIIKDCYSKGSVNGYAMIGGFIGIVYDSYVYNCYSTGFVDADFDYEGGFVGRNIRGEYLSSYWNLETSGTYSSAAGEGRTTADMLFPYAENTYVGWDFDSIWRDDITSQNEGYPTFLWVSGIEGEDFILPKSAILYQNYPNPFNPDTEIQFFLQEQNNVKLSILNSKGELVITLFEGRKDKGSHKLKFDASGLNSGVYFYKLTSDKTSETRKMLFLK